MSRKTTTEEFISRSLTVHPEYLYDRVKYHAVRVKVEIGCPIHGYFWQCPCDHVAGQGCPKCGLISRGKSRASTAEDFIKKATLKHGHKYSYENSIYCGSAKKLEIVCQQHGSFMQKAGHHLSGSGCPRCTHGDQYNLEDFLRLAKSVHGDKYDYSNCVYVKAIVKVDIICPKHGLFRQTPSQHAGEGFGCPRCGLGVKYTRQHKEIEEFLASLSIVFESDNRTLIYPKEIDIYIPSHNLAIEFNGTRWHSYLPGDNIANRRNKTDEENHFSYKKKHLEKFTACKNLGVTLFQIRETEWSDPIKKRDMEVQNKVTPGNA